MRRWCVMLALLLGVSGCAAKLPPSGFAQSGPAFNPLAFFAGHVTSWGVEENRAGQPTAIVTTNCVGKMTGPDTLRMVQTLHVGNNPAQTRIWQFTRIGPNTYVGRANDMVGVAQGVVSGRAFHWRWVLATHPGDVLGNVTMSQWMYQMGDGAVMIRTVVSKFGVSLIEVSEQFHAAGS
ncbi:MAG: DUF3833 family protein [Acidocella sp.]|nr:DUF3833 family protein [Acidocella sp.]